MCTVTFFPNPSRGFILSSSRDESPERKISAVVQRQMGSTSFVYPQDATAGGTWIAADSTGRVLCLLNGAFERHAHIPPYRKSRGLLVLEFMEAMDIPSFFQQYHLEGIEPFTLILASQGVLWEFLWDGNKRFMQQRDANAKYIWSSPTLYDREARVLRELWLKEWFEPSQEYSREKILEFHQEAGKEDPHNSLVMNRSGTVRTVSISQFVVEKKPFGFYYFELEDKAPVLYSNIFF